MFRIAVPVLLANIVVADVYLHNPRGSNDRNCERNVNRNNGDRLFNSQNNNAGGYACPRGVIEPTETPGLLLNEALNASCTPNCFLNPDGSQAYQNKKMYYYSGSILPIEYTNQHGCGGNSKVNCEIVLQYACEDTLDPQFDFFPWTNVKNGKTNFQTQAFRFGNNIGAPRDGTPTSDQDAATDSITDACTLDGNPNDCEAIASTAANQRYGMHENYNYYTVCSSTQRNMGLYTADQQINRNDQRGTRQNPNGNEFGFECPEERDYYPWWQPSPWIDIAVLSDSASLDPCTYTSTACTVRCYYYLNHSMNFHTKGYCDVTHTTGNTATLKTSSSQWQNGQWPNNRAACNSLNAQLGGGLTWYEVSWAQYLPVGQDMVCAKTQYSRVNQLGNARNDLIISSNEALLSAQADVHKAATTSVNANRFLWQVPTIPIPSNPATYFAAGMASAYQACVLRIRYNISTGDFQGWPLDAVDPGSARMVDWHNNTNPTTGSTQFVPITQNPYVYIGPGRAASLGSEFLRLKVNTNQYGRTFQDRTYTFSIKAAPTSTAPYVGQNDFLDTPALNSAEVAAALSAGGKIYNVNKRGKRGNIVQVYPSVEYDFVPDQLALNVNDMIHFQWTGSDYNPQRGCNDATGGPPDANTYSTSANTNQNSRADRTNIVFTGFMAKYTPENYLGYPTPTTLSYSGQRDAQYLQVLSLAPCWDGTTDVTQDNTDCYNQMMRLAYLNQQKDGLSLALRSNLTCLTVTQLNTLGGSDPADNHPLNCAKLNAKPTPYFDGGIMIMRRNGFYTPMDSRNNNFSNRMNKGIWWVGPGATFLNGTGVLEDLNPDTNGFQIVNNLQSPCVNTGTAPGQGVNGVQSCPGSGTILTGTTRAGNERDNDNLGDGTSQAGCAELFYSDGSLNTVEEQVVLAIILLFVGLFVAWAAYYMYNRYQARMTGVSKFRFDASWQATDNKELAGSGAKSSFILEKEKASSAGTGVFASKKHGDII